MTNETSTRPRRGVDAGPAVVRVLNEEDVHGLLDMGECVQAMDEAFQQEARGQAENKATTELAMPDGGGFRFKVGGLYGDKTFGLKAYGQPAGNRSYLIYVYEIGAGLTGIVAAHYLTQVRTGAVTGVATKYLSRADATTVGIIGTGREARTQLEAVSQVRALNRVKAFSRTPENREAFATEMSRKLGVEVVAVETPQECVADVDIVVTATSTREPVLYGDWLSPGVHVNAIGATGASRRELDEAAVGIAGNVFVELMEIGQNECGDLMYAAEQGLLDWDRVHELKDAISGRVIPRSRPEDITLFDSVGTGVEDVAIASYVLKKAKALSIGREFTI